MNYSLSSKYIKLEFIEEQRCCIGMYHVHKVKAKYIPNEVCSESDFNGNKETSVTQAIERLEWNVYYFELMNNELNKGK